MVKKEFGTLQVAQVRAIVGYFTANKVGMASEIGVSGSLMKSLCARGYAKIVDTKEVFVCIDEHSNTYRKVEVNVYALTIAPSTLAVEYNTSRERMSMAEKSKAERLIEAARDKLLYAENLLKSI